MNIVCKCGRRISISEGQTLTCECGQRVEYARRTKSAASKLPLGTMIKNALSMIGIKQKENCKCKERQAALDRLGDRIATALGRLLTRKEHDNGK